MQVRHLIAIGIALLVTTGCQRRQIYSPMPISHSQSLFPDATFSGDTFPGANAELNVAASRLTLANASTGIDEPEILTPQLAAEIAVREHPTLRTVRADRGIAGAQILRAGILLNPQLSTSFDEPAFGATGGAVTADTESISWDISQLRPLDARIRSACENSAAVDMDIFWQEWQFSQTARQAVYDLAALNYQLAALLKSQKKLEENLKLIEKAVNEGNLTIVDLSAAQSAAIAASTNSLALEQEIKQQRVVVNRATGRSPLTPVRIAESIEFPDVLELPPVSELLSMTHHRADLESSRRSYLSQEETLRAAVMAQIPSTSVNLTRASDTGGLGTLGAGISIDLQLFDRNQGVIAAESAFRDKLRDQYDQQVFSARSEVDSALADIESLEMQIETTLKAIPVFQELVETYDQAVREKNANVLVYYLAFDNMTQKQADLWRLRRQLMDAKLALETAVGVPFIR